MKKYKVGFEYVVNAENPQQAVDEAMKAFLLDEEKTGTIMKLKG